MTDYWRELLYPLGFLSAIAFSARVLIQWLTSEAKKQSTVMPLFWQLSLCGNVLLAIHAFIQVQFHVCAIQVCNAIISWRNLNLMQSFDKQISMRRTLCFLLGAPLILTILFTIQGHFLIGDNQDWFRIPIAPWQSKDHSQVTFIWHVIGTTGLALFGSRFWVQWWYAEHHRQSYLGSAFWWISLCGEGICLIYFLKINDAVNYIGPLFAMIPYIRNLMLIHVKPVERSHEGS